MRKKFSLFMKLNNFFVKPVVRPQATVFSLSNESREKELEQQISLLQKEVASLKDMTIENQNLIRTSKDSQVEAAQYRMDCSRLNEEMKQQQITIDQLIGIEIKYIESDKRLRAYIDEVKQTQSTINAVQNINTKQQTELTTLKQKYTTVSNNHRKSEQGRVEIGKLLAIKTEQLEGQNKELKQSHEENEIHIQEKIELEMDYEESVSRSRYWEETAKAFADQIDTFGALEQKLQGWIKSLTDQNLQETSRSKGALSRLTKSQSVIGDMDKTIQSMEADQKFLADTNTELRIQVSKPTYVSMGAMQRLENFKMSPMGAAVNRNKLYLGNGKPTLLKFGSGEQKHDNKN